jgi:large subunit ribosomal protein L25
MGNIALQADVRTDFGKGAARRLRATGRVPAVLYGHGIDPVHLSLPGHEATLALRNANALLEIHFEGGSELALPREIQRHPIRRDLLHTDLLLVRRGEKVVVEVPVHVTGEVTGGGVLTQENATLSVEAEATSLPSGLDVDVEGLEIGAVVSAGEVALPDGVSLVTEPDAVVIAVTAPQAEEEPVVEEVGEEGAAEAAEEGAEGESEGESDEQG